MCEIWTMGEILVEIMRPRVGMPLYQAGEFNGPFPSGAPAIFIDTVARLGHSAGIIGGVADDDFGKCLLKRLENDGVDTSRVLKSETGSTAVAFVTYFADGSRKFIFHIDGTPAVRAVAPRHSNDLRGVKFFHIMGCSLMTSERFGREILKTMNVMRAAGAKISFDPNIRPELMKSSSGMKLVRSVMKHCSIFEPGVSELLMMSGEKTVEEAVAACFKNPKLELIALKEGSRGCTIYTRTDAVRMGVYPVKVLDATGAGDCFDGALLCALLEGMSLVEAGEYATAAASLNTAAFGPMEGQISQSTMADIMKGTIEARQ